jgi:hypothetical protein
MGFGRTERLLFAKNSLGFGKTRRTAASELLGFGKTGRTSPKTPHFWQQGGPGEGLQGWVAGSV